ncbi:Exo_endo_phos domain-containing protein [Gossypium australe]|uniref:Exo_endo_phos domain-containing protein n=1 Tax=Gossypium australe TaxID=47621 RepID=A0A5B6UWQ1_9ROSI|nr:Exo_endo_phos domain-containing protein [Gossypium australe]
MEMVLEEENDPIAMVEGKKHQRTVTGPFDLLGSEVGIGPLVLAASSGLGWKGKSLINLKSFSSFHIDVEVQDEECGAKWRLTGFYGRPDGRHRAVSWNLLRQLNYDHNTPWVVLGDFNEIANSFEKKGGRLRSERQMMDFRMALEDCNLNDLGFTSRWFTWERGRFFTTNIRERLDRGVTTLKWMELNPRY